MSERKFLGVLGGMGPLATADFLTKLANHTQATCDQEHIPIIMYADCTTPDRTANIMGTGPSPLEHLKAGVRHLNNAGVRAICIPCNSAHYWLTELQNASDVEILDISVASVSVVTRKYNSVTSVGVLSTRGTQSMGLYRNTLNSMGFNVVEPTEQDFQDLVTPAIDYIKANQLSTAEVLFAKAAANLLALGAEKIILGCTEIPIGMRKLQAQDPELYIDSTSALAESAVHFMNALR